MSNPATEPVATFPRVGGVLILNDAKEVLLTLRKRPPERGCWSIVGGKVEFRERLPDAAGRETLEGTGSRSRSGGRTQ